MNALLTIKPITFGDLMTTKLMLINETDDESRIAIVEDNILQEMSLEHRTHEHIKNNIYRGKIVQIQTSLQAAFVDFGEKKHGFLPNSEINPNLLPKKKISLNAPIQHKLKAGKSLMVQVTKEAVDHKGAALTTNITLPGRFMVLMPNSNKGGVSKKIEDMEERERLKTFLSGIDSEKHAVIIRTAGMGRSLLELKKDYTMLKKTWEEVERNFDTQNSSGLVLEEPDFIVRTLRDYYTEDTGAIWVDNPETFQKALIFLKQTTPRNQKDLKLYVGDRSLFSNYGIERQVEQLTLGEIKLKSGGSIVLDQTEALVAIDVNSGKSNQEGNIDATAVRTNLEAAKEIARQLRLRNLGGLIVIDFIDMEGDQSRKKVEEELQKAMARDKAQRKFSSISQFGLLEMSRQRLTAGFSRTVESQCPTCRGKGKIPSILATTNLIIRSIREIAAKGNLIKIMGELPLELANLLLNERRQSITDIELEFGISIALTGVPNMIAFDESSLKSTFAPENQTKSTEPKKTENIKAAGSKKKGRRRDNESSAKKAEQTEKDPLAKNAEQATQEVEKQHKPTLQPSARKEAKSAKNHESSSAKNKEPGLDKGENKISALHPTCLFTDIQELDAEELNEITTSLENRLKGKIENEMPRVIDKKYLWNFSDDREEYKQPGETEETALIDIKSTSTENKKKNQNDQEGTQDKNAKPSKKATGKKSANKTQASGSSKIEKSKKKSGPQKAARQVDVNEEKKSKTRRKPAPHKIAKSKKIAVPAKKAEKTSAIEKKVGKKEELIQNGGKSKDNKAKTPLKSARKAAPNRKEPSKATAKKTPKERVEEKSKAKETKVKVSGDKKPAEKKKTKTSRTAKTDTKAKTNPKKVSKKR